MPSPKCRIPVSVVPSDWFLPVSGEEGYTIISSSITPGITTTLEGSIKVLIRPSADLPQSGSHFFRRERLSVRATMPWLNRNLPHFEYSRVLDIQYPVELRHFDVLPSLAQGSTSQFTFEVRATDSPLETRYWLMSTASRCSTKAQKHWETYLIPGDTSRPRYLSPKSSVSCCPRRTYGKIRWTAASQSYSPKNLYLSGRSFESLLMHRATSMWRFKLIFTSLYPCTTPQPNMTRK